MGHLVADHDGTEVYPQLPARRSVTLKSKGRQLLRCPSPNMPARPTWAAIRGLLRETGMPGCRQLDLGGL